MENDTARSGCKCSEEDIEEHTCPFLVEINDDSESLCTCCAECEENCVMDI